MKRRKGWPHHKHNKMPVRDWPGVLARMAKRLGIAEKWKKADEGENPMLKAFDMTVTKGDK